MKSRSRVYDIRFMRAMFTAAEAHARAAGQREPGAEHLVIACLGFEEGSARRVFERVGADPEDFKRAVAAQHADARRALGLDVDGTTIDSAVQSAPTDPFSAVRTASSARHMFSEVVRVAKHDRARLSGAYVVLVAAQAQHGSTARALATMGLDQEAVAAAARDEIDSAGA
jgi:ATP-dependent Clp protease ATP-binding subunit ClpA